jgi:hypothetical protein
MMSRIERGLLRLGVVLSVMWIGVVGLFEWPYANAFGLSGGDIPTAVGVVLIPPFLLLMLGAALMWVIRGFRAHDVGR